LIEEIIACQKLPEHVRLGKIRRTIGRTTVQAVTNLISVESNQSIYQLEELLFFRVHRIIYNVAISRGNSWGLGQTMTMVERKERSPNLHSDQL